MGNETTAQQLAHWAAGLDPDQVPPPVRAIAVACLVDTLGVAVGGADEPVSRLVRDHVVATYAHGASTVLGAAGGFCAPGAALANATAAHALDFDDNCYAGWSTDRRWWRPRSSPSASPRAPAARTC